MALTITNPTLSQRAIRSAPLVLIALGTALLAVHPAYWLLRSWFLPGFNPSGWVFALLTVALIIWSARSPRMQSGHTGLRRGIALILAATCIRALGQLLGINVLGAVTLVIDVYAIGLLLGLSERRRALSPMWLAVLFAMSLPLERVVQRTIGYPLQWLSADLSCALLGIVWPDVDCQGVRIILDGKNVLVDLPCSGARGLLTLSAGFCFLAALVRPTVARAGAGIVLVLAAGLAGNALRIVLLAIGIAFPESFGGIDVMAAPWHEGIGLVTLCLSAVPLWWWRPRFSTTVARDARCQSRSAMKGLGAENFRPAQVVAGLAFCITAVTILGLPTRPIDVSRVVPHSELPLSLAGHIKQELSLSDLEQRYFVRYGGAATRAVYGPFVLLKVQTTAPLRHLHSPDECLTAAGHQVRYLGLRHDEAATSVYRSVAPDGAAWRIEVSYVSQSGQRASNVAEAIWRWLGAPGQTWSMVQRVSPWHMSAAERSPFHDAVNAAFDLTPVSL